MKRSTHSSCCTAYVFTPFLYWITHSLYLLFQWPGSEQDDPSASLSSRLERSFLPDFSGMKELINRYWAGQQYRAQPAYGIVTGYGGGRLAAVANQECW